MKTIDDLPFLKAQAADLERLIAIVPPSAVIAKVQYEERLAEVRAEINGIENFSGDTKVVQLAKRYGAGVPLWIDNDLDPGGGDLDELDEADSLSESEVLDEFK